MSGSGKKPQHVLGIDIGGSGIKAAPVDIETGDFLEDRRRFATPESGDPESIIEIASKLRRHFSWKGPIGCAYPGVVRDGRTLTAANLSPEWVGMKAETALSKTLDRPVTLINDADAAGLAEVRIGAAADVSGVVMMVTLGTGIGTAMFVDGKLVPNTELGHLRIEGVEAEDLASSRAKNDLDLGWRDWSEQITIYLRELERLFWPDLFVIGGGISKNFEKFGPRLDVTTPVVRALMQNRAGIIGAALAAAEHR